MGGAGVDDVTLATGVLSRRIAAAEELVVSPPDNNIPLFEAIGLHQYELANRMNLLALRRLELARTLRKGQSPSSDELMGHCDDMRELSESFERIWRRRNRPSRLSDNMAGFAAAAAEAAGLARREV
jgi:hypothetical protein